MESTERYETWAVVELLGHKKLAGFVSEQTIAGAALIRVDVPETVHEHNVIPTEVRPAYTKLIGVGSIYCITPTTEEVARRCAREIERYNDPLPVRLPALLSAGITGQVDEDISDEPDYETDEWEEDDEDEEADEEDEGARAPKGGT